MRAGRVALLSFAVSGGAIATTPAFAALCGPTDQASNPTGPACDANGNNGGGAGTIGGAGGQNGDGDAAAQGGQTAGAAGGDGAAASTGNGGGGGGGAHGYFGTDLPTGTAVTGGAGGAGGDTAAASPNRGGNGGDGGWGAVVTGTGGTLSVNVIGGAGGGGGSPNGGIAGSGGDGGHGLYSINEMDLTIDATVKGGRGGDGGSGTGSSPLGGIAGSGGTALALRGSNTITINGAVKGGNGGNGGTNAAHTGGFGGSGGYGIIVNGNGSTAITVNAGAEVIGGNGGAAGSGSTPGTLGREGDGIMGQNLTIINKGSIAGGWNGNHTVQGNAVEFFGGTNVYEIWAGATTGGKVVDQSEDGTFRLGGNAAGQFDASALSSTAGGSAQYQGFAHLVKEGGGGASWTLNGNSSYAGDITVNDGSLIVTGSLASVSATTVNNGTLMGEGTLGGTVTVKAGAAFRPGDGSANSSMTVGSLALQSGALYFVSVDPSTSSKANVTGNASIGGAAVTAIFSPVNGYIEKQYTILQAGSISGTFASVDNIRLPSGFKTSLSYDADHTKVFLDLALAFVPPAGGSFGGNQSNAGNAIINYFNNGGAVPMAFGALTPQGLTQVSGEVGTSGQNTTFQANTQFMNVLGDVTAAGRSFAGSGAGAGASAGAMGYADEAMAYAGKSKSKDPRDAFASFNKAPPAVFAQRWSVWAMGFGGSQTTDGNASVGTNTASSSIYGMAVGADYRFAPDTVAGFALAGGGTNYSIINGGTGRSDLFQAGAFVRQNFGATYLTASAAYGWQDVTTDRYVTVAGVDHLKAEFNANSYSGRLELGHRFLAPWFGGLGVSPYAAAEVTAFELPSYAERAVSGSGTFALNYNGDTSTSTRSELGVRTDKSYALEGAVLTLRGRAAWSHNFDPDSAVTATFQSLPGASFLVNGARLASESALTTASAELSWTNGWSIAGTFEGEFSNVTRSYAGKGVVRYNW